MVNDVDAPVQPRPALVYTGVAIIVLEIVALVVLVVTKDEILLVPDAPSPIAVFEFVQL